MRGHLREIAQLLAFQHHNTVPFDPVACVHREEGEPDFMNALANELATKVQHNMSLSSLIPVR